MSKKQVTFRIDESIYKECEKIGKDIASKNPGAEANFSTIARYAIEEYLKEYKNQKVESRTLEIPIKDLTNIQAAEIIGAIKNMIDIIQDKDKRKILTEQETEFILNATKIIHKLIQMQNKQSIVTELE